MQVLKLLVENRRREYEIAINTSFGGFALTKEMCDDLGVDWKQNQYMFDYDRANPVLIDLIKKHKPKDMEIEKIELEDIPRAYLRNYDGREEIVYYDDNMTFPLMNYLMKRDDE